MNLHMIMLCVMFADVITLLIAAAIGLAADIINGPFTNPRVDWFMRDLPKLLWVVCILLTVIALTIAMFFAIPWES